jgi:hypothetical protein
VSPVKYELGFYIPQDDILHSHRRENLKPYMDISLFLCFLFTRLVRPDFSIFLVVATVMLF